MGLAPVPRKFTKLTKPILAHLHDLGHVITSFKDNSFLVGQTEEDIVHNVTDTSIKVFDPLSFVTRVEKSQFMPTQQISYLGFEMIFDMSTTITTERKHELREACLALLRQTNVKIRTVASCTGLMVASFLAVPMGPLHYKALEESEREKKR